jgi:hypothetical protein
MLTAASRRTPLRLADLVRSLINHHLSNYHSLLLLTRHQLRFQLGQWKPEKIEDRQAATSFHLTST